MGPGTDVHYCIWKEELKYFSWKLNLLLWAQIVPAAEKKSWGKHLSYKMEKKMTFEAYFMREIAIYSESLTMIEKERKTDNKKNISPHFLWKVDLRFFLLKTIFFNWCHMIKSKENGAFLFAKIDYWP